MRKSVEAFESEAEEVLLAGVGGEVAGCGEVIAAVHVSADGLLFADFRGIHRLECC